LRFFVSVPTDLQLRFRCWPFHFQDAPEQRVTIVVNGQTVDEIALRTQPAVYNVTIPRTALISGRNTLALRYAYNRAPSDLSPAARNHQPLAVAWDWMQIGSGNEPTRPTRDEAGGRALNVPVGTRIDYFTKVGPDTALTIDDIVPMGPHSDDAPARLRLELAT